MTDNEKELMPCPFCGGDAVFDGYKIYLGHGDYTEEYSIHCSECRCNHRDSFKDPNDAIKAWNTRPQPRIEDTDVSDALDTLDAVDLELLSFESKGEGFLKVIKAWKDLPIKQSIQTIRKALTQPKAVDVEGLKLDLYEGCSHTDGIIDDIIDGLIKDGYLNTNDRVKELEERLEIDHTGYDGIETRNESIRLQDRAIDELSQKLKVATEALKEADDYLTRNNLNQIGSGSILHKGMKNALQQIEGGRDETPYKDARRGL